MQWILIRRWTRSREEIEGKEEHEVGNDEIIDNVVANYQELIEDMEVEEDKEKSFR